MKALIAAAVLLATPGFADSCWDHNGSLMRLSASGNQRVFTYENPREGMRRAGVTKGMVLFVGETNGSWYKGRSRVFDNRCDPMAIDYEVDGPVLQDPLRIVVMGMYDEYKNCRATGKMVFDRLQFTYVGQC